MNKGITFAIFAAILFGASTPFAKLLGVTIGPIMLAGFLYAGSGIGLFAWLVARKILSNQKEPSLTAKDFPWLAGAVLAGGIVGPVFLMLGLSHTPASSASLLLNFETVFTTLLAWFVFKENFDRNLFLGMILIITAGILLSLQEAQDFQLPLGSLLVIAACLCWGIDNNLTRKVSASDPVQIACIKGLVAGVVNLSLGFMLGETFPGKLTILDATTVGFLGYGISLVMFVLALRDLGAARTIAYFSLAPFIGAAISLALLAQRPGILFWLAALLMMAGIGLHLIEHYSDKNTARPIH